MALRTTLETGRFSPAAETSATKTCAFTLLEILLVLVLVGLIGGVLAAGVGNVFGNEHHAQEDVLWQA